MDRATGHGGIGADPAAGRDLLLDLARLAERARCAVAQSVLAETRSAAAAESIGRRKRKAAPPESTFAGGVRESPYRDRRSKKSGQAVGSTRWRRFQTREVIMTALDQLRPLVGVKPACQALAVPRATWYRRRSRRVSLPPPRVRMRRSPRALSESEQPAVLTCLHEDRFQDCSPAQVYAALLDEGRFHCSIRTMYRLLETHGESRERRDQLTHPPYQKPELLATASQSVVELGHHQAARPGEVDLLSPLRHLGCLQPLRRRLDDRLPRKRRIGQAPDRAHLPQAESSRLASSPSTPIAGRR